METIQTINLNEARNKFIAEVKQLSGGSKATFYKILAKFNVYQDVE